MTQHLTVGLGNTLDLVLLLYGITVAGTLGGVDKLISKALSNGLNVTERGFAGTSGEENQSSGDTAERRDINGLTSDDTSSSYTSGVLTRSSVDDGVDKNLRTKKKRRKKARRGYTEVLLRISSKELPRGTIHIHT